MRIYDVIIEARVRKKIQVEARDRDEACEIAHEHFSVLNDDADEYYTQDTIDVTDVTEYRKERA